MIFSDVVVKTEYKYEKEDDENYMRSDRVEYLVLEFPLPGGKAIYEIKISKEFKDNIEKAAELCLKVQKT